MSKFTLRSNAEAATSRVLRPEVEINMATPMSALLSMKIGKAEEQLIQGTVRHSAVEVINISITRLFHFYLKMSASLVLYKMH